MVSYEKLGSPGTALQEYSAAEEIFTAELDRLRLLKSNVKLQDLLLAANFDTPSTVTGLTPRDQIDSSLSAWDRAALHSVDAVFIERVQRFNQVGFGPGAANGCTASPGEP
jgi:hypothetical protein